MCVCFSLFVCIYKCFLEYFIFTSIYLSLLIELPNYPTYLPSKKAQKAYSDGKVALNEYVRIMNDGLMLELNKLNTI